MLKLVLGRASSGKTTYVRNILTEKINGGEPVTLLVPEQFSFESEKAILTLLGAKKTAQARIVSFSSLSLKILAEFQPERKPSVTNAAKEVIMSMALEALSEKLEIFRNCAQKKKTVSELLHTTDELIQCGVASHEIRTAAQQSGNSILIKKAEEIELIAQLYETLLTERFSDDRYMLNAAAKIIAEQKLFAGQTVIFDEFSGFTAQENQIVGEILQQAQEVYVTQCAESLHDSSEGTGAFSYAADNIHALMALAKKRNVRIAEPVILANSGRYLSPAIAALERGCYLPSPEVYPHDAPEVTVAAARNLYEECDYTAMTAKKLVRETGIRYRDIVIISRHQDYEKYMPFALKKYGIPVFEDRRHSLENELIVLFSQCALSLASEGFTADCMLRYLKTGLTGISENDMAAFENYIFLWQIDRGGFLTRWTGHPDGFGCQFDEEAQTKLAHLNQIRKDAVFPLLKLKENLQDTDGFGCTKALYDFLLSVKADQNLLAFARKLDSETACECARSWDEFMNALSLLADTIGERGLSPARYTELFRILVSASDMGSLPGGLDEITIGDADRIRVSDKKVLFIVGANEGVFPAGAPESFVLNENERRLLKKNGVELSGDSTDKMRKERLRVYSAVSLPRERLYISYSLSDFKGAQLSPSEIVTMADRIVPRHRKIEISLLPALDTIESAQSAFECAAAHFSENTVFSRSLRAAIAENSDYSARLLSVERAAEKKPFQISEDERAAKLFGQNIYVTPSRVEAYYLCPFQYFCRYGLRVNPMERAVFDPRQIGLLIHSVLEKLFTRYGSEGLKNLTKEDIRAAVSDETNRYIQTFMGGAETLDKRTRYSLERSQKAICEILDRMIYEFRLSKFETRDVELKIDFDGDVPPYSVAIPGGGRAVVSGIVDRVDTMLSEDGETTYLRVIDYKTGGKDFKLNDIASGLNIQMLVYLMCLFENGRDRYGSITPAGVLYVPAKQGANELKRGASAQEIESMRIKQGRMHGIVLKNPEVINGMEEGGGGVIIEAKLDKNGNIKGKTFDLHQFSLLHKAVDRAIAQMAHSLHKGKVAALPMLDGSYTKTCDYCAYKAVCCREEDDACATLRKGDIWEILEENENG